MKFIFAEVHTDVSQSTLTSMDSSTQTSCHYAETSLMRSTDDSFYDFRKLFVQGLWSNPIDLSSSYQYQSDGLQSIEEVDENDKEAEEEENSKQKDTEVEVETVYPTVIQSSIYTALELPIENLLDEMINLAMTEGNSTTSSNSSGIEVGSSAVSSCSNKSSHLPIILREEFNFGHYYPKNKRNSIVSLTDKYSSTFTIAGCGTVKSLRKSRGFTRSKPKFSNGSVFRGNERIESKIVVAIDFGTAQCGFAYTLQTEFNSNRYL